MATKQDALVKREPKRTAPSRQVDARPTGQDYDAGKILVTSPLAQGLLGLKVGQKAEIQVPAGVNRFEILEIRFEE